MIWYSESLENVTKELQTDLEKGLGSEQAAALLKEHGPNKLNEKPPRSFFPAFSGSDEGCDGHHSDHRRRRFSGAERLSHLHGGQGDWIEPIVIILIVVINGLLGVIQESKAEAALEALKNMSAPEAKVLRDGMLQSVKSTDLVPGDIVEFEAGDLVPADCRLLEAATLKCDEAALTGESVPVDKNPAAAIENIASLGDRVNMVYSGCAVSYGRGRGSRGGNRHEHGNGQNRHHAGKRGRGRHPPAAEAGAIGKISGLPGLGHLCGHLRCRSAGRTWCPGNVYDRRFSGCGGQSRRACPPSSPSF